MKFSGKIIFASILLFVLGSFYLILEVSSWLSSLDHSATSLSADKISISRSDFISDLRAIITVISAFTGGILLIRKKRAGWVISIAAFALYLSIISVGLIFSPLFSFRDPTATLVIVIAALFLLALFFLLQKSSRIIYSISPVHFAQAAILLAIYLLIFFWLA